MLSLSITFASPNHTADCVNGSTLSRRLEILNRGETRIREEAGPFCGPGFFLFNPAKWRESSAP